jgi:uncharacterized protein (TIGR04222 family)
MPDPRLALSLGTILGSLIVLGPALVLFSTDRALRTMIRRTLSSPRSPSRSSLTLWELAYLVGGARRVGRTVLLGLLLDRRVRVRGGDGGLALTAPVGPAEAVDPVRGEALSILHRNHAVTSSDVVSGVEAGATADGVRRSLESRGLLVPADEVAVLLARRRRAARFLHFARPAAFVVAFVGMFVFVGPVSPFPFMGAGMIVYPFLIFGTAFTVVGVSSLLLLVSRAPVEFAASNARERALIPRTTAGMRELKEAEGRYPLSAAVGRPMDRDTALYLWALHGTTNAERGGPRIEVEWGLSAEEGEGGFERRGLSWEEVQGYAVYCSTDDGGTAGGGTGGA